jgi:hypothetical protein
LKISLLFSLFSGNLWSVYGAQAFPFASFTCRPAFASGTATRRGHWAGETLVIDVTNFSPKTDVFGSREDLHLVERWARTGPRTLAYEALIEDPTVWTRPWTIKQEFARQSDEENRIYYEPRCIEGNFSLPGLLGGACESRPSRRGRDLRSSTSNLTRRRSHSVASPDCAPLGFAPRSQSSTGEVH